MNNSFEDEYINYYLFNSSKAKNREAIRAIDNIYHYTPAETVPHILCEDGIHLRMTRADEFDDKSEGEYVILCYRSALEQIKKDSIITDEEYNILKTISIPKKRLTIYDGNPLRISADECETYIICFSTEKNSEKLFEEYAYSKSESGNGCALAFSMMDLEEATRKVTKEGINFAPIKIVYENDIKNEFVKQIISGVSVARQFNNQENGEKFLRRRIADEINQMRYASKKKDYDCEKEVRLICHVPKNSIDSLTSSFPIKIEEENGRHCIYWIIDKDSFIDFTSSPSQFSAYEKTLRDSIKERGYHCSGYDIL